VAIHENCSLPPREMKLNNTCFQRQYSAIVCFVLSSMTVFVFKTQKTGRVLGGVASRQDSFLQKPDVENSLNGLCRPKTNWIYLDDHIGSQHIRPLCSLTMAVGGGQTGRKKSKIDFKSLMKKLKEEKEAGQHKTEEKGETSSIEESEEEYAVDQEENDRLQKLVTSRSMADAENKDEKPNNEEEQRTAKENEQIQREIEELERKGMQPKGMPEIKQVINGTTLVAAMSNATRNEASEQDKKTWEAALKQQPAEEIVYNDITMQLHPNDTLPFEEYPENVTMIIKRNREQGWPVWWSDLYPPDEAMLREWRNILMEEWGDMGLRSWNSSLSELLAKVEEDGRWGFGFDGNLEFWGPLNRSKFYEDAVSNSHIATRENPAAEERWKQDENEEMARNAQKEMKGKYFDPFRHARMLKSKFEKELRSAREQRRNIRRETGEDDLTDAELTDREDSEELKRGLAGEIPQDDDEDVEEREFAEIEGDYNFEGFPDTANLDVEEELAYEEREFGDEKMSKKLLKSIT